MNGNWNKVKGKLIQKFALLKKDDLIENKGVNELILGRIQDKFGKTKEELEKVLSE